LVIVEGIDGTGKTTIVSKLEHSGMNTLFYNYDPLTQDLVSKYKNINIECAKNSVSDRSFISEIVYGTVVRGHSRLAFDDYKRLLEFYANIGTNAIYLKADLKTLLTRRQDDPKDLELLNKFFEPLNEAYDKAMEIAQKYISVLEFDTVKTSVSDIILIMVRKGIITSGEII